MIQAKQIVENAPFDAASADLIQRLVGASRQVEISRAFHDLASFYFKNN